MKRFSILVLVQDEVEVPDVQSAITEVSKVMFNLPNLDYVPIDLSGRMVRNGVEFFKIQPYTGMSEGLHRGCTAYVRRIFDT